MMRNITLFVVLSLILVGCNLETSPPTETPSPVPATTIAVTNTAVITVPATHTATATATASSTPTATNTPTVTFTPSNTPTPSVTPAQAVFFSVNQLSVVDIPSFLADGIDSPLVVFANSNNQSSITNIATGQPQNTAQFVYVTAPGSTNRTQILELQTSDNNRFYPSPTGSGLAYFVSGVNPGLYILNILPVGGTSFSARIWQTDTLIQRQLLSEPVWTSDGESLAVTQQTAYALDIFLYARDTSTRVNLTESPAYDMFPAFSPDSRYMAFVSDRDRCPSWNPADENFCDYLTDETPTGGTVHLLDRNTGEVRQISDDFVTEPPRWINNNVLVFAVGNQNDLLNPQRTLWIANIVTGQVEQVVLPEDADNNSVLYIADAWTPDGQIVVFQRATVSSTEIVMMTVDGTVIRRRSDDLSFPRFGVQIDWSAQFDRVVIGGVGGRCPYGIRVADSDFDWVATGNAPSICNPIFSPDGQNIVFTGISPEVDGRLDIYTASENGFGQVLITGDLLGSNTLIGWLGQ